MGYGDLVPVTDSERALLIVMMLIGGLAYSYIIAAMASIVSTMDAHERQFNEKMDCADAATTTAEKGTIELK